MTTIILKYKTQSIEELTLCAFRGTCLVAALPDQFDASPESDDLERQKEALLVEGGFQQLAEEGAGEKISATEVHNEARSTPAGGHLGADGRPGESMVSEPEDEMETLQGGRKVDGHGGGFHPGPRAPHRCRHHNGRLIIKRVYKYSLNAV